MDRDMWQRVYSEFLEMEDQVHEILPPVTQPLGTSQQPSPAVAVGAVDVERVGALMQERQRRWDRFVEFVRTQ